MTPEEKPGTPTNPGGNPTSRRKKALPWARSKQLEQDLAHVQEEMYKRNLELVQTNKTLTLLQAIDSLVLSEQGKVGPLSKRLSGEVAQAGGYPFVAIFGHHSREDSQLEMYGWADTAVLPAPDTGFLTTMTIRDSADWFNNPESVTFFDLTKITDVQFAHICGCSPKQAHSLRHALSLRAACLVKLQSPKGLLGIMMIGFTQSREGLTDFEEELFGRLSEAIGIALDHKLLLEENERYVAALKRSNARLRLLDRTKDDFISMASHQLRTPLTAVKGYVSMVLDGDPGKLNQGQEKMLTQAFLSAQRMVYLISDLLNVSRLRTGKFIIEAIESNLANVIQEELDQLTETIKGRGLELTYHKPERFPTLMLDETKIRQVIMNFVDNAIYYTPNGGHIEVKLIEKPESVEFTVVDDGIGVPKQEQHNLFSKFYRAKNARTARPDGTGLGLFIAKKVIAAQGGAIIFKSTEGRGSTFGFTLPKAALQSHKTASTDA